MVISLFKQIFGQIWLAEKQKGSMKKKKMKRSHKVGLPPGSLIHLGERKAAEAKISLIEYNQTEFSELCYLDIDSAIENRKQNCVSWLNIDGLHETDLISATGIKYNLHPLVLEDILNTDNRPKVEEFDDHLFVSLKMIHVNQKLKEIESEQISFILGKNWLVSFQEQEGDIFGQVRERLRESKGLIRQKSSDYLLYRLIDTVVDHYFFALEHIADTSEELEQAVLKSSEKEQLKQIQTLKKEIIDLKRAIFPLREIVSTLQKEDHYLIEKATLRYLRDVYEHIIQMNDSLDSSREAAKNIMDLYLSGINNKMNEVMKVLTIISTIFIPLSFVAGLYGMNFDNIPELHWKYGYYAVWVVFIVAVSGMLYYFKRKDWL
jgi:magnesium transporter